MDIVLRRLTGKTLDQVPSDKWVSRVLKESNLILNRQIAEKMMSEKQMTLASDTATHSNISFLGSRVHFPDGSSLTTGIGLFKDWYEAFSYVRATLFPMPCCSPQPLVDWSIHLLVTFF